MSGGERRPGRLGEQERCGPVLIVDEDERCRAVVSSVLESGGYSTLESATGEAAIELAARGTSLRLVVLEVCLPGISGYQVCRVLREHYGHGLPIIFISGIRTESFDRVAGLLIGADDYLAKPFAPDELLIRVSRLVRLSTPLSPTVAAKLTRREREVLGLFGEGLSVREAAERLYLSPKTVSTHCENILHKLGVRTRAQAVALAFETARRDTFVSSPSRGPAQTSNLATTGSTR